MEYNAQPSQQFFGGMGIDIDLNLDVETEQTIMIAIGPENDIIGEVELEKQIIEIGPEQENGVIEMIAPYGNFESQTIEMHGIHGTGGNADSNIEIEIENQLIELTEQANTLIELRTPRLDSHQQIKQKEYIAENDHSILPLLPLLQDFMGNLDQQTINKLGMDAECNEDFNTGVEIQDQAIEIETERDNYIVEMVPPGSSKKSRIKKKSRKGIENSTSPENHFNEHPQKPQKEKTQYECTQCNKTFSCKRGLANHKTVHIEVKPFQCSYCDKSFVHKKVLLQHQKKHTRKENAGKPYQCKQCKEFFTQKKDFAAHQRKHVVESLFHCSRCDMCFSHKTKLAKHEKTHKGKQSYQCKICGKYFSVKQTLDKHHRVVHQDNENSYKCSNCETCFSKSSDLVQHLKQHLTGVKAYQCSHCEMSFVLKGTLLEHLKIHTGVTKYHCSQCEFVFFNKWALVIHQKTHNG